MSIILFDKGVKISVEHADIWVTYPIDGTNCYGTRLDDTNFLDLNYHLRHSLFQDLYQISHYLDEKISDLPFSAEFPVVVLELFGLLDTGQGQGLVITAVVLPNKSIQLSGSLFYQKADSKKHRHASGSKVVVSFKDLKGLYETLILIS